MCLSSFDQKFDYESVKFQFEVKPRPGLLVAEGFINIGDFGGTKEDLEETKDEIAEEQEHHNDEEEEGGDDNGEEEEMV